MQKNIRVILLLLLLVTGAGAGAGMLLVLRNQARDTDLRRKRDADAFAVRNALFVHMRQHDGALPSSLNELSFERSDVDPSPFRLIDPGIRKGRRGLGLIAQAPQGGNGRQRIVIYTDGTVRWE